MPGAARARKRRVGGARCRLDPVIAAALALLLAILPCAAAAASETGLSGAEGHPRSRFPLALHAAPTGDAALDDAVRRAVGDWNAVARAALGVDAFAAAGRPEDAAVLVTVERAASADHMGQAHVTSSGGVIALPVRVVVAWPAARGQTSRETLLYQVTAHELGHALGLRHVADPRSLMCCVEGGVDLRDAGTRAAYVAARRNPDLATVQPQLAAHYERYWRSRGE